WRSGEPIQDARALAWLAYYNCRSQPIPAVFRQAIEQNELAIRQGMATAAVFNNLGYCYLQMGDLAKAKQSLLEGLRLSPKTGELHRNMLKVELAVAARAKRPPDRTLLIEARRHNPLTGDLAWDGALFGAMTATYCDDDTVRDRSVRLTFSSCRKALDGGIDPKWIAALLKQFPVLKRDNRFQELLDPSSDQENTAPSPHETPTAALPLINPLGG
ncbi:MAG: hypothetical protein GXP27_20160, partial [Planctomycetes bacterium]|nr:hypothetical protein [Planctomycetota bacterium]